MNVVFRPATPADLSAISTLLAENKLPLDGVSSCVNDFILAEEQGKVVGSIGLERYGGYGLLRSAAVCQSLQGQGLGASLVDRVLRKAKAEGIEEIFLLTLTAESYFPRFGFGPIARSEVPEALRQSEELRSACPDTAVVMRRRL